MRLVGGMHRTTRTNPPRGRMARVPATHRVQVDPEARTAMVGGGVTWAPVLAEAQRFALAPLVGSAPHVGAVGYSLGGGFGWPARRYGLAGTRLVDEWRAWRAPALDMFGVLPFSRAGEISQDPVDPPPASTNGRWLAGLSDDIGAAMRDAILGGEGPSPALFAETRQAGGAVARPNPAVRRRWRSDGVWRRPRPPADGPGLVARYGCGRRPTVRCSFRMSRVPTTSPRFDLHQRAALPKPLRV